MGPPGAPFRLGPGAKCPSCPPPPPPVGGPGKIEILYLIKVVTATCAIHNYPLTKEVNKL